MELQPLATSKEPLLNTLGLNIDKTEKAERDKEVAEHGLGVITAAIFLAGEMAGSGVLALPFAMVGTGIEIFLLFSLFS